MLAHQRELIYTERQRIARELHDSVTQYVLSSGMTVELARGDAEALGEIGAGLVERLTAAKQLSQEAVEQMRRAIYALHQSDQHTVSTLPELLAVMADHHRPQLQVDVRVEGDPAQLPADADHEIARAVGEALFNVATHAHARRAVVRLRYLPHLLTVTVDDDGIGDPAQLRRTLRLEQGMPCDGRHRGLVNIEARMIEVGGTLSFRRARLGGVGIAFASRCPSPRRLGPP